MCRHDGIKAKSITAVFQQKSNDKMMSNVFKHPAKVFTCHEYIICWFLSWNHSIGIPVERYGCQTESGDLKEA